MVKEIAFRLNGIERRVAVDIARRLLDFLRDEAGLTAVKEGCGEGECGACSVLMDGRLVNACLVPMAVVGGSEIVTLEGLRETAEGRIIIEAFADSGSVQCGFCTPGMVMAAYALLKEHPDPTEEQIRVGLSGNLCRCTGYTMLIDGVRMAAERGGHLW